jgi:hypothetical protein
MCKLQTIGEIAQSNSFENISEIAAGNREDKYCDTPRWSTCPLGFFSWLLDHVIYLKLKKKYQFAKLSKFTILTQNDNFLYLLELSFCEFHQLCKQLFLSQLEINHVIQQATEKNYRTCRPS